MSRRPDDPRTSQEEAREGRSARVPGDGGRYRDRPEDAPRHAARTEAAEAPPSPGYGNGPAIAALVVGLLAVTLAFLVFPAIAAVLMGITAIILGVVGVRNAGRLGGLHKGLSITGLVTGALALVLGAAVIIGGAALFDEMAEQIQLEEFREQLPDGS